MTLAVGTKACSAALIAGAVLLLAGCMDHDGQQQARVIEPVYDPCRHADCTEKGSCAVDDQGGPSCVCEVGYYGARCDTCEAGFHLDFYDRCVPDRSCADQSDDPCGAHGVCGDDTGVIECECDFGYEGPRCNLCQRGFDRNDFDDCLALVLVPEPGEKPKAGEEAPPPQSNPEAPPPAVEPCQPESCSGNGACEETSGGPVCTCEEGYRGTHCATCGAGYRRDAGDACVRVEQCTSDACSARGLCDDTIGRPVCVCELGYGGNACERCASGHHLDAGSACVLDQQCLPTTCGGHGRCSVSGGVTSCVCETGYEAPNCDRCASGYHREGERCVVNEVCTVASCSGHGTCDAASGLIECTCEPAYWGDACEVCAPGHVRDSASGACRSLVCTSRPAPFWTFENMIGFPPSENTCQTGIGLNTSTLNMASRAGLGQAWACGPSTLYPITTKHVLLEAGPGQPAQMSFGSPIGHLRFDYAASTALALDPHGDGMPAGSAIMVTRRGGGSLSFSFAAPITVFEFRVTNGAANQIALDNIAFEYASCE